MKRQLFMLLLLVTLSLSGCTKKLQNDSPKRESTGDASASEGYKDANKETLLLQPGLRSKAAV